MQLYLKTGLKDYDVLDAALQPFAESEVGYTFVLEDDNALTHRNGYKRSWMDINGVYGLPWPVEPPDLNSCEDVWGICARKVYKNNRQFHTLQDLEELINDAVSQIDRKIIKNLFESMQRRCIEELAKQRKCTHF